MLLNTLLLALRSIRRNLMRSFLTILGIVIGVSAVITMVTLGTGATLAIQNQISGLGTNLLQVRPGQRLGPGSGGGGGGAPAFKESDAEAIATQIGGIAAVAPEARTGSTVVANGRNWTSSIIGSTNDWLQTGNWKLASGREFSDDEMRGGAAVCLIGETVRRELYGKTAALGGLIGIVLATGASIGLAILMDIPYTFNLNVNLLSFVFSAAIGVLFGYFPARRAARMDPIEALRHE